MPGLILKLRAHEQILINGVVMQNGDRRARLVVKTPDACILRLRDALHPDEVDTPVKRVCYMAQLAVAGETDAAEAAPELERGIEELQVALDGVAEADCLGDARAALQAGNFYGTLKALRQLIPLEERLLALDAAEPAPSEAPALT